MPSTRIFPSRLAILLAILTAASVRAAEPAPQIAVGNTVVVASDETPLMVGANAIAKLAKGTTIKVTATNGSWIGGTAVVAGAATNGWVKKADVTLMPAAAPVAGQPAGNAKSPLDGTWELSRLITLNEGGTSSFLMVSSPQMKMVIDGAAVTITSKEEGKEPTVDRYTLTVDAKAGTYTRKSATGELKGIYRLENGALQMCVQKDGTTPDSFTITKDNPQGRFTYEWEKAAK